MLLIGRHRHGVSGSYDVTEWPAVCMTSPKRLHAHFQSPARCKLKRHFFMHTPIWKQKQLKDWQKKGDKGGGTRILVLGSRLRVVRCPRVIPELTCFETRLIPTIHKNIFRLHTKVFAELESAVKEIRIKREPLSGFSPKITES